MNNSLLFYLVSLVICTYTHLPVVLAGWKNRQTADFNEGGLPSHLPSPPSPEDFAATAEESQPESQQNAMAGEPAPPVPPPPPQSPSGPLGLSGTILILVPEFKYTINRFPKWFGASVKLSFPITFFFDQLGFQPGAPDLPFPFGPWVPPSVKRHYTKRRRGKPKPKSRYNGRRPKRHSAPSVLSLPPPTSMRGGERALLFPRLERFLQSTGIPSGRDCLLRTVCEVHETDSLTRGYGLLGDMITLLFRSSYADSHLPEYLSAEESGKAGNCEKYYSNCTHSIFETIGQKEEQNQQCEVLNGDNFCE